MTFLPDSVQLSPKRRVSPTNHRRQTRQPNTQRRSEQRGTPKEEAPGFSGRVYPLRGGLAIFSPDVEDLSSFLVDQRLRLATVTLPKQFWNRFSHRRGLRQTFFSHPVGSKIYKKETSIKLLRLKKGPSATGKYLILNMYWAQWGDRPCEMALAVAQICFTSGQSSVLRFGLSNVACFQTQGGLLTCCLKLFCR